MTGVSVMAYFWPWNCTPDWCTLSTAVVKLASNSLVRFVLNFTWTSNIVQFSLKSIITKWKYTPIRQSTDQWNKYTMFFNSDLIFIIWTDDRSFMLLKTFPNYKDRYINVTHMYPNSKRIFNLHTEILCNYQVISKSAFDYCLPEFGCPSSDFYIEGKKGCCIQT